MTRNRRAKIQSVIGLLIATILLIPLALSPSVASQQTRGQSVRIKVEDGKEIDLYEESHALVIGVSDYKNGWRSLRGVKDDIPAIRAALEKHGFNVKTVLNPTRNELDQVIYRFIAEHGQQAGNRLLLYFAGHGATIHSVGGTLGYIVPIDASPLTPTTIGAFKSTAISMSQIEVYAEQIEAKHALFVFDSCFSGSLFEFTRATPPAISNKTALPVRQFITAGTAEQEVPDNSIFRQQFVDGLNGDADLDKDGFITGSELGMFLETRVTNYSKESQTPRYGKVHNPRLDKGDFVFALKRKVSAPLSAEDVYWQGARESGFLEEYQAYLQRYPNGKHVEEAKAQIKELDVREWQRIQNSKNIADFERYLQEFENGEFHDLARNRVKRLKELPANTINQTTSIDLSTVEPQPFTVPCGPIFFARNLASINNEHIACLDYLALKLHKAPYLNLVIDGHRDSSERVGLSLTRANNARDYLVSEKGIDASRITVRNYGDSCRHESGDASLNRRIEIFIGLMALESIDKIKRCGAGSSPRVIIDEEPATSDDRKTTTSKKRGKSG